MKAKAIFLTAAAILFGSLIVLAMNLYSPGTAATELGEAAVISEPMPITDVKSYKDLDENAVSPLTGEISVDEIEALLAKYSQSMLSQPGWLYIQYQVDREWIEVGNLPDGSPIPQDYISEEWYLIDDEGLVCAVVSKMLDLDGNEVQVGVFENLYWTSLTFEEVNHPGERFTPNFDADVGDILMSIGKDNGPSRVEIRETTYAGAVVIEVLVFRVFESPVQLGGAPMEVEALISRTLFDPATGALIIDETVYRTVDKEENIVIFNTILTVERVEVVPDNILSLFKEPPQ